MIAKRSKVAVCMVLGVILIAAWAIRRTARNRVSHETISLECARQGATFELVTYKPWGQRGSTTDFVAVTATERHVISRFDQMRGFVDITNEQSALSFVRLRTTLVLSVFDPPSEYEIVTKPQLYELLKYRPNTEMKLFVSLNGSLRPYMKTPAFSGLTEADFKQGRFTSPRITKATGGFVITRWIYAQNGGDLGRVLKLRETVGSDGTYKRDVLEDISPPQLPYTEWYINRMQM
jgi:hypothetical protein